MKASTVLPVYLFVALLCATGEVATDTVDPHLVHFGDIKLIPCTGAPFCHPGSSMVGTLWVYYGDNYRAPEWRPVCKEFFSDHKQRGSTAICNILGYQEGSEYTGLMANELQATPHFVTSTDYALTSLNCTNILSNGAPPNHLLRCGNFSSYRKGASCSGQLTLTCSIPKGHPLPNSENAYEGQVQLCPPDQLNGTSPGPATQVSMGIVTVLGNSYWGSLNANSSTRIVNYQQASSACRQMGFTGAVANSVRTVQSYNGQYTFTKCQHPAHSSLFGLQRIWLRVEQSQLCTSSCPCFSCCYNHPSDRGCRIGSLNNGECSDGHCCIENDVVIECTFDQTSTLNEPPAAESGSETICGFHGSQSILSSAPCSQEVSAMYTQEQFLAGVLAPATVAVVLLTLIIILIFCLCKKKNAKQEYEMLQGENNGNA